MGEVVSVWYGAHGWRDGVWRHGEQVEREDGRVVVYVAKGSHATYPEEGTWWRIWGHANDVTEKGVRWDVQEVVLMHGGDGGKGKGGGGSGGGGGGGRTVEGGGGARGG